MLCDDSDEIVTLTDDQIKALRSLSIDTHYDATFVRILLEFVYKDRLNVLFKRSFTGKTRQSKQPNSKEGDDEPFQPISPQKKRTIFRYFKERITNADLTKQEQFDRLNSRNIIQLVSKGISNVRNTLLRESQNQCSLNEN